MSGEDMAGLKTIRDMEAFLDQTDTPPEADVKKTLHPGIIPRKHRRTRS
jgi:hypothetical protein